MWPGGGDDGDLVIAKGDAVAVADGRGNAVNGARTEHPGPCRLDDCRKPANMVVMVMRYPYRGWRPSCIRHRAKRGVGVTGVDKRRLAACRIKEQHPVIVTAIFELSGFEIHARYHTPVFSIEAQGSAGASASPSWRSSIEMLSGERTKAILPSRGGRLIVTPLFMSFWQVA